MQTKYWMSWEKTHHEAKSAQERDAGARIVSLSLHGAIDNPRYSAVVTFPSPPVPQHEFTLVDKPAAVDLVMQEASHGFVPALVAATGSSSNPRFALVFEQSGQTPTIHFDLEPESVPQKEAEARGNGLILKWAASYGESGSERIAAIWAPNTADTPWSAQGVLDTPAENQRRFDQQYSAWCRPSFLTMNDQERCLSLYVADSVGPWRARTGYSFDDMNDEIVAAARQGLKPVVLQGAGQTSDPKFAAIFAKQVEPLPRRFLATGPAADGQIDAIFEDIMKASSVAQASLAITYRDKLVYVRGYTYGNADTPIAQPTTRFRIASVSKLVTALLVYLAVERGKISLDTKVQDVLQLTTPSGGPPADAKFGDITVEHLLRHRSGLHPQLIWRDFAILQSHQAAQPTTNWELPVDEEMTDRYIASQPLVDPPDKKQIYQNTDIYLLARTAAAALGYAQVFRALRSELFVPLEMLRSRASPVLLDTMPWDEARYRAPNLQLRTSVMENGDKLVPWFYGSHSLKRLVGPSGLSLAATDLGRIMAILLGQSDVTPLKWSTIRQLLDDAVASRAINGRAGHGWDNAVAEANGTYRCRKGGSLGTSGNSLDLDGEFGFAACWGGKPKAPAGWFAQLVGIAKNRFGSSSTDLFPEFGMSPTLT